MTPLVSSSQLSPLPPLSVASLAPSSGGPNLTPAHLAAMYSPSSYADQHPPYPLPALGTEQSAFYSPAAAGLDLKESLTVSPMTPTWPYPSVYYPYDSALASYPFAGYGMGLDAARRKNATREATATLKAWLNEHKKNPYPTKGEKIMLAIITKMTLTQVSTWFANARRRLKKENKMTWEPRTKTDDDDEEDDDKDDEKMDEKSEKMDEEKHDKTSNFLDKKDDGISCSSSSATGTDSPGIPSTDVAHPKPRIWSLADMATSGGLGSAASIGGAGKIVAGSMVRGLHLEGSPYSRPLFSHVTYPYIPPSVSESILSYSYNKSLHFPHHLTDVSSSLLSQVSLPQDLSRSEPARPEALRPAVSRTDTIRIADLIRPQPQRSTELKVAKSP